jgi:hypothetical protein
MKRLWKWHVKMLDNPAYYIGSALLLAAGVSVPVFLVLREALK